MAEQNQDAFFDELYDAAHILEVLAIILQCMHGGFQFGDTVEEWGVMEMHDNG